VGTRRRASLAGAARGALLRELRTGDAGTTQRREWVLRASAADPLLGALIRKEG
jgi:hypothetical protein